MICSSCLERQAFAKGLCNRCYQRQYYRTHNRRIKLRIQRHRTHKRMTNPVWHQQYKDKDKFHKTQPHVRFANAQRCAGIRHLSFMLTPTRYAGLTDQECYYCLGALGKVLYGIGLDRIDNQIGYQIDNVLPCCQVCNRVRSNIFTVAETHAMIQIILQMRNLTNYREKLT